MGIDLTDRTIEAQLKDLLAFSECLHHPDPDLLYRLLHDVCRALQELRL